MMTFTKNVYWVFTQICLIAEVSIILSIVFVTSLQKRLDKTRPYCTLLSWRIS